jgi:hypothetical protein
LDSTTITSIVAGKVDITNFISYRIGVDSSTNIGSIVIFKDTVFNDCIVTINIYSTTFTTSNISPLINN